MEFIMPRLDEIGGHNENQVHPIKILETNKQRMREIEERLIQKIIENALRLPRKIRNRLLSPRKIKQLANNLEENGIVECGPACLKLTIKSGYLLLHTSPWLDTRGLHPRPLEDLQELKQYLKDISREIDREEASPQEVRAIVIELAKEAISKQTQEMNSRPSNEVTLQEAQIIVQKLAIEAWVPKRQ